MRAVFRVKLKRSLTCSKEFSLRVSVSPAAAAFVTQTTQRLIFCPTNRQTHLTRSTARVSMQLKKKTGSGWYFCKPPPKEHGVPNVTAASPCWQIRELCLMFVMSYTLHISSLWILWSSFCLVLFLCMWVINMLCGSSVWAFHLPFTLPLTLCLPPSSVLCPYFTSGLWLQASAPAFPHPVSFWASHHQFAILCPCFVHLAPYISNVNLPNPSCYLMAVKAPFYWIHLI